MLVHGILCSLLTEMGHFSPSSAYHDLVWEGSFVTGDLPRSQAPPVQPFIACNTESVRGLGRCLSTDHTRFLACSTASDKVTVRRPVNKALGFTSQIRL